MDTFRGVLNTNVCVLSVKQAGSSETVLCDMTLHRWLSGSRGLSKRRKPEAQCHMEKGRNLRANITDQKKEFCHWV